MVRPEPVGASMAVAGRYRGRMSRRPAPLALALLALLVALAPFPLAIVASAPAGVVATPLPLDPRDPARRSVGRLDYVGGWALRGSDRRFGGISSMTLDHGLFTMLSDTGIVTQFRFAGSGPVVDYAMHALPDGPGSAYRKVNRDSESSTRDPVTGRVWAGFETRNEIWRYTAGFAAADGHAAPPAMADWPNNRGAEAMVRLHDGRFLVFAETKERDDDSHLALAFPGDPVDGARPIAFGLAGPADYAVTDAAELPDGRVVVLMRRFSASAGILSLTPGFSAAVAVFDPTRIRPGATIRAETLAMLAPPLTVDNMEALAIEQRGARTLLWIASDDNFFVAQRTLLLCFALRGERR